MIKRHVLRAPFQRIGGHGGGPSSSFLDLCCWLLPQAGAWANQQGYIVITSVACTDQGNRGPVPSFEHLVTKEHLSPYCARRVRGETWW